MSRFFEYNTSDYDYYDYDYNVSDKDLSEYLECQMYPVFQMGLMIYSIMVMILYIVLQKRVKQRSGCCGLPIPINLVYESKDRWVYAAVFGALSGTFAQLIFGGEVVNPQSFVGSIFQGFYLFLIMLFIPLLFFALIASIHGRIQVITHAIGLIYIATILTQESLICQNCIQAASTITPRIDRIIQYVYIYGTAIPIMLCNALTGVYFLIRGTQGVISILTGEPFTSQNDIRHHLGHVKQLLAKKLITEPSHNLNPLKKLIKRFMYKRDPYFKYPVRVFCITGVVVVGLLLVTVDMLTFLVSLVTIAESIIVKFGFDTINVVKVLIYIAYSCAVAIPAISYVVTIISFLLSMIAYRDHCKRVWKGDYSFVPIKKQKPPDILIHSTLYIGWQIAMVMWAWLFYVILLVLVATAGVIVGLSLWYVSGIREWVLRRAILFVSATITGMIFAFGQSLLFRCLFAKGKSLIVNNGRLFHIYTYFLLFYNALIGIGAAIRRIVTSAVISLFFLTRLDRCLLIRGFEDKDEGYMTYLSAVRIDAAHNNPVMNVFIYFLSQRLPYKYGSTTMLDRLVIQKHYQDSRTRSVDCLTSGGYELKYVHGKARKMWHLAYTLIKNPDIAKLRRRGRKLKKSASKLATLVTSKNSHISDFAYANELAINNEGFEVNVAVNEQAVNDFEVETVFREPAERSDIGFGVEAVVNKLAVKNDNGIELEATVIEPAAIGFEEVTANVLAEINKLNDGFEVKENS